MLNIYVLVIWLSTTIIASFALIIALGSSRSSSWFYALTAAFAALWTFGMGAYHVAESHDWIMFWGQWNHFMGGLIAATFFYFSFLFPEERHPHRGVRIFVLVVEGALLYFYAATNLIIKESFLFGPRVIDRGWVFGELGWLFHTFFAVFFLGGFINLYRKILQAKNSQQRSSLRYVFWGSIIGVLPAGIINVWLPLVGSFTWYWIGPSTILAWVAVISYAIARHQVLNVKVIMAEAMVLAMTIILFLNIFLSEVISFGMYGGLVIFLAFVVVGMFFIASIRKSEMQKQTLESLTSELRDLSQNLQQKVEERTAELASSKAHIETVIENLATGLLEYDNHAVLLRINRAGEKMLMVTRADVVGSRILPEDHLGSTNNALAAISYPERVNARVIDPVSLGLDPHVKVHELTLSTPRENVFQVLSAPITVAGGRVEGMIKIIRDVTRQRMVERSKSEFISIAAHQLRTPLSILKWILDLTLKGEYGVVVPKQREALGRAFETNEKMIQLVGDLLSVARIEDRRFGYQFKRANVALLLEKIASEYTMIAKTHGVRFQYIPPATPTESSFLDEEKIGLAVRNVLDNAMYYTPKGGTVELHFTQEGAMIVVTVKDTGIGIPRGQFERLFTRFFRAENAMKMQTKGSGLGLFIVKSVITRHGGTVEIESEEEKGTVVHIRVPLARNAPPEEPSASG